MDAADKQPGHGRPVDDAELATRQFDVTPALNDRPITESKKGEAPSRGPVSAPARAIDEQPEQKGDAEE
jgi:hypothetical protein